MDDLPYDKSPGKLCFSDDEKENVESINRLVFNTSLKPKVHPLATKSFPVDPNSIAEAAIRQAKFFSEHGQVNVAIKAIDHAISVCNKPDLLKYLFFERANLYFKIQNFSLSFQDCCECLKFEPNCYKTLELISLLCIYLKKYKQAIEYCDRILIMNTNPKILEYKKNCQQELSLIEKQSLENENAFKEYKRLQYELLKAIEIRGIRLKVFSPNNQIEENKDFNNKDINDPLKFKDLLPSIYKMDGYKNIEYFVELYEDILYWPMCIVYPGNNFYDTVHRVCENSTLENIVYSSLFKGDEHKDRQFVERNTVNYNPNNIEIYFEDPDRSIMVNVPPSKTLKNILSDNRYLVITGIPVIYVVSKILPYYTQFHSNITIEMF